jgi:hypothetical protein
MAITITIGADPEVFIRNTRTNLFVSAHNFIPGTKKDPFKTTFGAIQKDGVAAEFNIIPAKNAKDFISSVSAGLSYITDTIADANPELAVEINPTAEFPEEYFNALPDQVRELGCEPDFDAYTGEENKKPATDRPMRTGAGHIHVGWRKNEADPYDSAHFAVCQNVVKLLECSLFLPSLSFDNDTQRRELYGNPGAFRPKTYGVEYRVLSNAWLKDDRLMRWVFNTTLRSVRDLYRGKKYFDAIDAKLVAEMAKKKNFSLSKFAETCPHIISLPLAA